jgi:hypothetical protein
MVAAEELAPQMFIFQSLSLVIQYLVCVVRKFEGLLPLFAFAEGKMVRFVWMVGDSYLLVRFLDLFEG